MVGRHVNFAREVKKVFGLLQGISLHMDQGISFAFIDDSSDSTP